MTQRAPTLVAAVLLAVGLAALVHGTLAHEGARDLWEAERALQGTDDYDATRSDVAYEASLRPITLTRLGGGIAAIGLLLLSLSLARPPRAGLAGEPASGARVALASALDLGGGAALAASLIVAADGSLALEGAARAAAVPVALLPAIAMLPAGSTMASRLLGVRWVTRGDTPTAPSVAQALVSAALLPTTATSLAMLLPLHVLASALGRHTWVALAAPHAILAGLLPLER